MYQPGDEESIVDLFQKVFKRPYSKEQWKWRFANNPAGNHKIALMWDKDTLAGHYAVSPVDMLVDGQPIKTALSLTTMTHPDYGGRGVFKQLASYLYDQLENKGGFELIWGFPNNNSHYGFIKHLGWQDISILPTLSAPVYPFIAAPEVPITKRTQFDTKMSRLLQLKASQNLVFVDRSVEYLNWRIVDKPATQYDIWTIGEEENPEAVVITKSYKVGSHEIDLNIVDWSCLDIAVLPGMLGSIIRQIHVKDIQVRRVTLWQNVYQSAVHGKLERMGFAPAAPITYLAGRVKETIALTVLDIKNWHLSFMDSDVY